VVARFSVPAQTDSGAHPDSCKMGTGSFPGVESGRGVTLTPHPFYCRGLKQSSAIHLLSRRAFVACKRDETNQNLKLEISNFYINNILNMRVKYRRVQPIAKDPGTYQNKNYFTLKTVFLIVIEIIP
jgi:hypothetical protein